LSLTVDHILKTDLKISPPHTHFADLYTTVLPTVVGVYYSQLCQLQIVYNIATSTQQATSINFINDWTGI